MEILPIRAAISSMAQPLPIGRSRLQALRLQATEQSSLLAEASGFGFLGELFCMETPAELSQLYGELLGQQLQGEMNRFAISRTGRRGRKQDTAWQKQWEAYLFEGFAGEGGDDAETFAHQPEFFGDHVSQGSINDCYLIAAIYAALRNPFIGKRGLAEMISPVELFIPQRTDNGGAVFIPRLLFEVRFPGYPDIPIHIDPGELQVSVQVKGGVGFRILERAFARLSRKLNLTKPEDEGHLDETLVTINGGGFAGITLHALTGNEALAFQRPQEGMRADEFMRGLSFIIDHLRQEPHSCLFVVSTPGPKEGYSDTQRRFIKWHVFTLVIHRATGDIVIVNPWDTQKLRHRITLDELARYFDRFMLVETPAKSPDPSGVGRRGVHDPGSPA